MRSLTEFAVVALLLMNGASARSKYSPQPPEETEVFATVLRTEIQANSWSDKDLICLMIDGKDPGKSLLKSFRMQGLRVAPESQWEKRFDCSFGIRLQHPKFQAADLAEVHLEALDFRGINARNEHIASLMDERTCVLQRTNKKWSVIHSSEAMPTSARSAALREPR